MVIVYPYITVRELPLGFQVLGLLREFFNAIWNWFASFLSPQFSCNIFVIGILAFVIVWNYWVGEIR